MGGPDFNGVSSSLEFGPFFMIEQEIEKEDLIRITADGLKEILEFIAGNPDTIDTMAAFRRCMTVIWVLRRDLLNDISLAQLAKELGVSRSRLSKISCSFSDQFNFLSDRQRLPGSRMRMRQSAFNRQKLPSHQS